MVKWGRSLTRQAAPVRILAFVAALAVLWLPCYGVAIAFIEDPNTLSIVVMGILFIEFLVLLHRWNRWVYGRDRPLQRYGLRWNRAGLHGFLSGIAVGLTCLPILFLGQWLLGWVQWTFGPGVDGGGVLRIALEGLLVAVGVALGEEIIFRGWILEELERDYAPGIALWGSSVLFAVLHFIRPLSEIIRTFPQFPGLVLLGLMLVWAKRSRQGCLGIAIGLHAGLIWGYYIVNVGGLVRYSATAPQLWSGIDQNPLAGLLGIGFLTIPALWFRHHAIVAFRE